MYKTGYNSSASQIKYQSSLMVLDYLKMLPERLVKLREAGTVKTLLKHQAETCEAAVAVDDSESY